MTFVSSRRDASRRSVSSRRDVSHFSSKVISCCQSDVTFCQQQLLASPLFYIKTGEPRIAYDSRGVAHCRCRSFKMLLSPADVLHRGLVYVGYGRTRQERMSLRNRVDVFHSHYGSTPFQLSYQWFGSKLMVKSTGQRHGQTAVRPKKQQSAL